MDASERRAAILSGQVDLWPVTWVADLPAPAAFLVVFAGTLPEIPTIEQDQERYHRLLSTIRSTSRTEARQKAVDAAQDLLNLEAPAIFLLHRFQHWLVRNGVEGLGLEDFSWHDSDQVSISEAR